MTTVAEAPMNSPRKDDNCYLESRMVSGLLVLKSILIPADMNVPDVHTSRVKLVALRIRTSVLTYPGPMVTMEKELAESLITTPSRRFTQYSLPIRSALSPRACTMSSITPTINAKRSTRKLNATWKKTLKRRLSKADRAGLIYVFYEDGLFKVGKTNDMRRRIREWDTTCPAKGRKWFGVFWTPFANRTESLVHILLEANCCCRPRFRCRNCGRVHIEKFKLRHGDPQLVYYKIVVPPEFIRLNVAEPARSLTMLVLRLGLQSAPHAYSALLLLFVVPLGSFQCPEMDVTFSYGFN
ncbi:hypothetical protein D9757_005318 [Collybiopsis confluens]|uniref:Bacteriophage T5 Orf172 DNA-binding domain-containing protein n=1 Tax=Collybiopsis confluens TaxID=2823264 RepID=A0A8H5FN42_9AGAR|nr:hypothetical protein D9757_015131 [Collybiopsis confluens]KAF5380754.1 hypothetical protein D9757_007166 [Collybiopsis confluens]KAF5388755.1 hypothetical protein D9757_015115 [Collybiopsis confluens]KAF5390361.1 hypothetical protein D9757_005318 [Collybiopsis confluens]